MLNSVILFFSVLPVQNLHTAIQDTSILIIWTNPDDTTIDYILVRTALDNYPDTLGSGIRLYPVYPETTDTFVRDWNLYAGNRYYFSIFTVDTNANPISYTYDTVSSPSPYPPTVEVYPVGFWTNSNIIKMVFNDTMDTAGVIRSIDILSYHCNDTIYNYQANLISRKFWRRDYCTIRDTFTFVIKPYLRSLDTVVVHILSDSARDVFGWMLDGNRDNVQQGSPDDDVSFAFYSSILGDFNMDGNVDIQDLNGYFRQAILYNDTTCDIGPAAGTVPYLQKEPDGIVNIEDVGVFTQMWTWSIQHFGIKLPQGIVSSDDVLYKFDNDTMRIFYNGNKNFTSAEIFMEGNIEKFFRGNIFTKDAYLLSTIAGNITLVDIVNPFSISKGELLKVICDKDTKVWIKVLTENNHIVNAGEVCNRSIIKKYSIDGVNLNISGVKRYKIFDITGRLVLSNQTTKSRIILQDGLSSGIYFLKLYYPVETKPIKIIKLR